jgi:hypothetical protein
MLADILSVRTHLRIELERLEMDISLDVVPESGQCGIE